MIIQILIQTYATQGPIWNVILQEVSGIQRNETNEYTEKGYL